MPVHNPANERIKRRYFVFLKDAKSHSEATVDAVAQSIARFESSTGCRDFRHFHLEQAVAFKRRLAEQRSQATGDNLSEATLYATLGHLKRFFQWLSQQPGYRSRIKHPDADYFSLPRKESRVATARREKAFPTIEQVKHVIAQMPSETDIQRRDRALVAFILLTGARDGAVASMKLKHVDLVTSTIYQDAREVRTKFSKSFKTVFFPVGDEVRQIVEDWVRELREEKLWGNDDPLFPATHTGVGANQQFAVLGLKREHWAGAGPIRSVFRAAFERVGLPYHNPHSLRDTLVQLGQSICQSPEDFKAWSVNLGHEGVMTTFYSYGAVSVSRQREILLGLAKPRPVAASDPEVLAEALVRRMREAGMG